MDEQDSDVAIVTGSSRGIGRATAERLAAEGAAVVVTFRTDEEAANDVVDTIESAGGRANAVQANVTNHDDVVGLYERAEATFGQPTIVVNAAGSTIFTPVADATEDQFDRMFDTNAKGAFFVLQEAAHRIADGGRIVNISTAGTGTGAPGGSIYLGSKAAAEQFVRSLAMELGHRGVRVNTVSPGLTNTDGLVMPPEQVEAMVEQTPLGRLGEPADVADVIASIVSDDGRWLSGQNIRPSGGL